MPQSYHSELEKNQVAAWEERLLVPAFVMEAVSEQVIHLRWSQEQNINKPTKGLLEARGRIP